MTKENKKPHINDKMQDLTRLSLAYKLDEFLKEYQGFLKPHQAEIFSS